MELDEVVREAITPAMELLGLPMTPQVVLLLLAIGLQESRFIDRRQLVGSPPKPTGPAKSFWQAEEGGGMVAGVRTHAVTRERAARLYAARGVSANNRAIWNAVENDDVLAAGLARLLLLSDPKPLPVVGDAEGAWQTYLRTWRPGAFANGNVRQRTDLRNKWALNYARAQALVQ